MNNKIKIAYYTSTRADYGIVSQLLDTLYTHLEFDLKLIVSGMHLDEQYGKTYQFINQEIPAIFVPITMNQSVEGVSEEIAETVVELTKIFQKETFDYVVVLGDRYEAFAAITAARICNLKIVHIHGGEVTEGAVDEYLRHAMTKLSNIHFVTNEEYYQRVIQMGEQPDSVFNIGSFSVENILTKDLDVKNLSVDFDVEQPYYMMTYHAETLQTDEYNFQEFKTVINKVLQTGRKVVLIKSNSDHGGALINNYIDELNNPKVHVFKSLPYVDNLILIKNAQALVGNSSSGIIEVPYLKTPTINIGNRQGQRVKNPSRSIINLEKAEDLTVELLLKEKSEYQYDLVFGEGHSIDKFITIMQQIHKEQKITTIKKFKDL